MLSLPPVALALSISTAAVWSRVPAEASVARICSCERLRLVRPNRAGNVAGQWRVHSTVIPISTLGSISISRLKTMMLGFFCEHKRDWFRQIPDSLASLIFWFGIGVGGLSLLLTLFGLEMKSAVVATGALLLAPCLMAYLSGRPMFNWEKIRRLSSAQTSGLKSPPPKIIIWVFFAPICLFGQAMKWLGERTYSIYLWQEPFTICNYLPNLLQPAGALVSIAVGGLWFHLFERPFLSASRRK